MRIAWFSPVPPDHSGIAAYTQELVPLLQSNTRSIDVFVDAPGLPLVRTAGSNGAGPTRPALPVVSAQEFVWRHRRAPYDLIVYQLGNASCHDYMWAYLFRYPGLLVLHDLQVHQSRALWLLRRLEPRLQDYLAELRASHPDAPEDFGHLIAAGLGGLLYHLFPLLTLAVRASRISVVHSAPLADALAARHPGSTIAAIAMGVADPCDHRWAGHESPAAVRGAPMAMRARQGIPADAIVIGAFGGITPEKRIPQLLRAVAALGERSPAIHVWLVGQRAAHYDVDEDARALGIDGHVHIAGYVADEDLAACMRASDVCCCLRWPSNGETSASWLRCLGAGRPTIVTALAQLGDVPSVTLWSGADALEGDRDTAVTCAVDPLDEPAVLSRVIAALCEDKTLAAAIGANARRWWEAHHQLPQMAARYEAVIAQAATRPDPAVTLPAHVRDDGTSTLRHLLSPLGLEFPLA